MDANREETLLFVLLDFSATLGRAQHYKAKEGKKKKKDQIKYYKWSESILKGCNSHLSFLNI